MPTVLVCAFVLVGAVVVAVVIGGIVLSGCLGMDDSQPDDWTRGEDE